MSSKIEIYTDGSCIPNPGEGGWAFVILYEDTEIGNSGYSSVSTNNIMELTAVIESLKLLLHISKTTKITLYTDSMYVINCAKNIWDRKKNKELWKDFDLVSKNKNIEWVWVKGHQGNYYNEIVDKMAKNEVLKKK